MSKKDKKKEASSCESRRTFLKTCGAAILVGTALSERVVSSASLKKRRKALGMVIDLRKCTGCHTCSIACKSENEVPLGVWKSSVKSIEKGKFPNVSSHFLPKLCNHCENPPCQRVCPVKATYTNKDGVVLIDPKRCIGCRYCIATCPYEARFIHPETKIADKCDLCIHKLKRGERPACVDACPQGARVFGDLNDPTSEARKLMVTLSVRVLKPEKDTRPKIYYIGLDQEIDKKKEVRG